MLDYIKDMYILNFYVTFWSFGNPSLRFNRDGWSFQDALVKWFQAKEVVIILFSSGFPREIYVRDLARNYRQFAFEFGIQEMTNHSTFRDGVYFHRQS